MDRIEKYKKNNGVERAKMHKMGVSLGKIWIILLFHHVELHPLDDSDRRCQRGMHDHGLLSSNATGLN